LTFGQGFVGAYDQKASGSEPLSHLLQQFSLQRLVEVAEDKIAAEYDIELLFGHLASDILAKYRHRLLVLLFEAVAPLFDKKRALQPWHRQLFEAAVEIAPLFGTSQHFGMAVRRDDLRHELWKLRCQFRLPDYGEGIGLLSRGASGTPDPHDSLSIRTQLFRQFGKQGLYQMPEHTLVPVEAGDRNAAHAVKLRPLALFIFKIFPVGFETRKTERFYAPLYPFADLFFYFSEPAPL